jgi:MOSC domain-containing protein YiiM
MQPDGCVLARAVTRDKIDAVRMPHPMVQLVSVQVGRPRDMRDDDPWVSAIFKDVVSGGVRLNATNLVGDQQADLSVHGGPDKAVCVYSADHLPFWRETLVRNDMTTGAFGENFSLTGVTEDDVCIGDVYEVGTAVVQISQPRSPCWKLARKWWRLDLPKIVVQEGKTGWYFRVLRTGDVAAGQELRRIDREYPQWTITEANRLAYARKTGELRAERHRFAECEALSAAWRASMGD